MREHYPAWDISVSLVQTIAQIVETWQHKLVS
jgi:CDP-paratose 2-epimerase